MKNTYSEMKDSGFEWIGKIPSNWKTVPAKFFIKLQAGYPFDSDKFDNFQGIPLIRIRDITSGYAGTFYKGDYSNEYIVQNNDLLVGMDGDFNVRWWQGGEAVLNQRCCRIFGQDGLLLRYFYYLLPFYLKIINELAYSTTVKHLSNSDILKGRICLPPLPEQTAIAAYLDEKCGAIDEIIAEAKASIEEYKAWKSSVIFEAVTKGLDPHAEMKDSGVEWMGDIPKHWKCVPMKYLLQERNQKNDPIVTSERLSLSIDIGVTLYAEKTTNLDRFKEDVSQYKVAHAGDLVLNSMNMIVGAVGIAPVLGCVSPAYYIFYDNSPKHTSARFCDYVFKNKRLRGCLFSLGQGIMAIDRGDGRINTCRLKVSRDDLGRIMLPCPPEDEQEKIITYLDNRFAAIDGIIAEKEALIADMEAYKKSLVFETVTGKRKVC